MILQVSKKADWKIPEGVQIPKYSVLKSGIGKLQMQFWYVFKNTECSCVDYPRSKWIDMSTEVIAVHIQANNIGSSG